MFGSLDRTALKKISGKRITAAAAALAMTATLAGCVSDVPPPIVPPPVYSAQPYPGPYYAAPAPQAYYYPAYPAYPSYYGPCCSSVYFGYSSGWHRGGDYHRWHR